MTIPALMNLKEVVWLVNFDFPPRPVPIDEFNGLLERRCRAVRQQAPFDRFAVFKKRFKNY